MRKRVMKTKTLVVRKKKRGPKPKRVKKSLIFKLASIHCTVSEIAEIVGVHERTLERRYLDLIKKGRAEGVKSLKRKQFQCATFGKGNSKMLIWLGKQYLDQKDRKELCGPNGQPLGTQVKIVQICLPTNGYEAKPLTLEPRTELKRIG